jgi:F-type H+-transporting ATPase subunit epsilon
MDTLIDFALLTPAQQVAAFKATFVTVDGADGQFGVLPGHAPLVSMLAEGGKVVATDEEGKAHTYTVTAGVANVTPNKVTVLAEDMAE